MPFTNAKLTTLNTTVTGKGTAALKVASCLPGLLDAIFAEICESEPCLSPAAQNRLATLRADLVANAATMQTALGL
jgi:hypothetical protein